MKVLGIAADGKYIAIVEHAELEKCADKYYGKVERLKVGDSFDIGQGHNFRGQIVEAARAIGDGHAKFLRASETMTRFASMVAQHEQVTAPAASST